jgi:hypothetical protein
MLLAFAASFASAATQSVTGVVTDDMCGRKHNMMPGKPDSECIRACVKAGAKYALLAGDKVYLLKGNAKQFDQFAGKKVKVTGDLSVLVPGLTHQDFVFARQQHDFLVPRQFLYKAHVLSVHPHPGSLIRLGAGHKL